MLFALRIHVKSLTMNQVLSGTAQLYKERNNFERKLKGHLRYLLPIAMVTVLHRDRNKLGEKHNMDRTKA